MLQKTFIKVCSFSRIQNGVKYDYPFEEAILSILPLCNREVVAVGRSDNDTLPKVRAIDPKVVVLEARWDEVQRAIDPLWGIQPQVMQEHISAQNWPFVTKPNAF